MRACACVRTRYMTAAAVERCRIGFLREAVGGCVWAEDACLFNQRVSFGTQSGGLLTTIWRESEEEQMREKTLAHPVGSGAAGEKMNVAGGSLK